MTARPMLLVTGAAGKVATRIRPRLADRYRLRLADVSPPTDVTPDNDVLVADLLDLDVVAAAVAGVDAVVHLAGNPRPTADWVALEPANVRMTQQLLEAACRAGVSRVVLASSVHAAGAYIRDTDIPVDPAWPAKPCCLYGASKAAGEAIGAMYATRHGMPVTCLRLGYAAPQPKSKWSLAMWVSPRDLAHLIDRALGFGPDYGVYFGISDNTRSLWRIDNARHELGYHPVDNAERYIDRIDSAPANLPCWARAPSQS
jgi:UDP-glucose 4-epimerase